MQLTICLLTIATALAAADKSSEKKPAPPQARKSTAATQLSLPAGAVETEPGTYRYTDPQGKKWIYRKTPFGLSRFEDKPAGAAAVTVDEKKQLEQVTAVEDGDTIRFERPGPFGRYKWQRKKGELNESERAVWEREQARRASRAKE